MSDSIKTGDRVRVVLEGEVHVYESGDFEIGTDGANWITPDQDHVVSVEKIEPPVTQFKPGQIIKHKRTGSVYLLTAGTGCVSVGGEEPGTTFDWWTHTHATSDNYELVEVGA